MKQKYIILRDDKEKKMIIREFAELDKDVMSALYEETYDQKVIQAAIKEGKDEIITAICTNNLYPFGEYAEKMAESIIELYQTKDKPSAELFFDDKEMILKEQDIPVVEEVKTEAEPEKETDKADDLLKDDDPKK